MGYKTTISYAARPFSCCAWLFRNGSYTSPVTHNRCSNTASFRATATTARFFAFLPPRAASFSPQRFKSVSGPRHRIQCAPCTSNWRKYRSPSLLIRNCGWLSPDFHERAARVKRKSLAGRPPERRPTGGATAFPPLPFSEEVFFLPSADSPCFHSHSFVERLLRCQLVSFI